MWQLIPPSTMMIKIPGQFNTKVWMQTFFSFDWNANITMNDNKIMVWMSMLWPIWGTIQHLLDSVGEGERERDRQRHKTYLQTKLNATYQQDKWWMRCQMWIRKVHILKKETKDGRHYAACSKMTIWPWMMIR
jgi:hypothetical protein